MTEIPENKKSCARQMIDPVAFFGALILAPLIVTAATFWLAFIPVFALLLGGPVYLVLGTPVLLWHLSYYAPDPSEIAGLAMATVAITTGILVLASFVIGGRNDVYVILSAAIPSLIFAPLWGATFGWLYTGMRNDFYTQTA